MKYTMLPFNRPEIRKAHFLASFGRVVEDMAIISFGACNYNCPYCKRDGQFKGDGGEILRAQQYDWDFIKSTINTAVAKGQRVRLSGGDPCMFPRQSLRIAEYVWGAYGQKISIAHNGSSPRLVRQLLPYLEYAALDVKGGTNEQVCRRADITSSTALESALECINLCADAGVLVDVRTCVFGDTSYEELEAIKSLISSVRRTENVFWTLRKYNEIASCDFAPGDPEMIRQYAQRLTETAGFGIGFRDKWTGTRFQIW